MQIQLAHDVLAVTFHGLGADDQRRADLVVTGALREIRQHFALAISQAIRVGLRVRAIPNQSRSMPARSHRASRARCADVPIPARPPRVERVRRVHGLALLCDQPRAGQDAGRDGERITRPGVSRIE